MSAERKLGAGAALIVDGAFRAALAEALAELARAIKARDHCTDAVAIERAMLEYNRLVFEVKAKRDDLRDAQDRKRREDEARANNRPTLSASLGSMAGRLAALRDKLPAKREPR